METNIPVVAIELRKGSRNEDRAQCYSRNGATVLVLADGAGGIGGGALAAEIVLQEAELLFLAKHQSAVEALYAAQTRIELIGGMSTGIIVELRDGQLLGASCGDSIAWLICSDSVQDLTSAQRRKPLLGDSGTPVAFGPVPFAGRLLLASDGLVNYTSISSIVSAATSSSISNSARLLAELPRLKKAACFQTMSLSCSQKRVLKSNCQIKMLSQSE